jgi:hypothetical protein
MSAREFGDDDEGYLAWIDANPGDLPVRRHHGCARETDQSGGRAVPSGTRGSIAPVRTTPIVKEFRCR